AEAAAGAGLAAPRQRPGAGSLGGGGMNAGRLDEKPGGNAGRLETTLVVNEIFHSIQGESRHAGRPCVFVRLTGCNLRCTWCDTAYAFEEGDDLPVSVVLERVASYGTRFVLLTGGEPLAQAGVHDLAGELCDRGHEVAIETGGSLDIAPLDRRVMVVMDLKCPASDMSGRNR